MGLLYFQNLIFFRNKNSVLNSGANIMRKTYTVKYFR